MGGRGGGLFGHRGRGPAHGAAQPKRPAGRRLQRLRRPSRYELLRLHRPHGGQPRRAEHRRHGQGSGVPQGAARHGRRDGRALRRPGRRR
ncbi:MAG: hypothetical protein EGQ40_01500 [Clostridiales bacterium]|nr:hypothetical protein [Clostridiales bacterium]